MFAGIKSLARRPSRTTMRSTTRHEPPAPSRVSAAPAKSGVVRHRFYLTDEAVTDGVSASAGSMRPLEAGGALAVNNFLLLRRFCAGPFPATTQCPGGSPGVRPRALGSRAASFDSGRRRRSPRSESPRPPRAPLPGRSQDPRAGDGAAGSSDWDPRAPRPSATARALRGRDCPRHSAWRCRERC